MTTDETSGGSPESPESPSPPEPPRIDPPRDTVAPPAVPAAGPLGILPALPERRAWPWSLLLAVGHQVFTVLGAVVLRSHSDLGGLFFAMMVGLVPLAFIVGLVMVAQKRSFPGRVLMFGALYSCALVALEIAIAAGVCLVAFSKPGGFH